MELLFASMPASGNSGNLKLPIMTGFEESLEYLLFLNIANHVYTKTTSNFAFYNACPKYLEHRKICIVFFYFNFFFPNTSSSTPPPPLLQNTKTHSP